MSKKNKKTTKNHKQKSTKKNLKTSPKKLQPKREVSKFSDKLKKLPIDLYQAFLIFVKALILLSIVVLVLVFYQIFIVFKFPETVLHKLPADNTLMAVEWVQKLPLSERDNLIKYVPDSTLDFLLYFENQYLDQTYAQALKMVKPESKAFAKMTYQGGVEDVFIFSFTEQSKLQFLQIFKPMRSKWKAAFINNEMYVTQNPDLLDHLSTNFSTLGEQADFEDAYYNIPKQNFATFYFSPSIFTGQSGQFGTSLASLRPSEDGIYLATYTNPADRNTKFYETEYKYQGDLLSNLPEDPELVFSALELSQRLNHFLQLTKIDTSFIRQFLMSYNLDEEAYQVLHDLFQEEVAFAKYENNQFLLVTSANSKLDLTLEQIAKYQAFLNAKPESHTLESGVVARNLVPNFELGFRTNDENTYIFPVEADPANSQQFIEELILYKQANHYYLSNSSDLIQRVKAETKSFKGQLDLDHLDPMFELADDFLYLSSPFLEDLITANSKLLETRNLAYPEVFSVGNYFLDGIQTIHLLKW